MVGFFVTLIGNEEGRVLGNLVGLELGFGDGVIDGFALGMAVVGTRDGAVLGVLEVG